MLDLLQKAAKLGMDVPTCRAPACRKGKLPDCTTCLSCRGTGLDEDPARVLMAVTVYCVSKGDALLLHRDRARLIAHEWWNEPHKNTPETIALAALKSIVDAAP